MLRILCAACVVRVLSSVVATVKTLHIGFRIENIPLKRCNSVRQKGRNIDACAYRPHTDPPTPIKTQQNKCHTHRHMHTAKGARTHMSSKRQNVRNDDDDDDGTAKRTAARRHGGTMCLCVQCTYTLLANAD